MNPTGHSRITFYIKYLAKILNTLQLRELSKYFAKMQQLQHQLTNVTLFIVP